MNNMDIHQKKTWNGIYISQWYNNTYLFTDDTLSQTASGTEEATEEGALHSSQESLLGLPEDSISSMDIDLNVLEKV